MNEPTIEEKLKELRRRYVEEPAFREIIKRQARALQIALEIRARKQRQDW